MTATQTPVLTHDESKAAEAAFRGLPLNPSWSQNARLIYEGILDKTKGRDILEHAVDLEVDLSRDAEPFASLEASSSR